MMMKMQCLPLWLVTTSVILCVVPARVHAASYDLGKVKGMEAFSGSAAAKELLRKNGFVVADPAFRQIFEAYIESPETDKPSDKNPLGQSLPSFIKADSAWHTYHVLSGGCVDRGARRLGIHAGGG